MMSPAQALLWLIVDDIGRAMKHQAEAILPSTDVLVPAVRQAIYGSKSIAESAKWKTNPTIGAYKCTLRHTVIGTTPYIYNNIGRSATFKGVVTVCRDAHVINKHVVRKKQWKHYKVDLLQKTCECGWGKFLDGPCSHILGYANSRKYPIQRLLREHQKKESWLPPGVKNNFFLKEVFCAIF